MFTNRRSSQKPNEDFYHAFKQSFPDVGPGTSSTAAGPSAPGPAQQRSASYDEAVVEDPPTNRNFDNNEDETKDVDATPKPYTDQWRLTPSLMDPNSMAFTAFANQMPGYYTPTPGGINTFYHSSAGDLHTPGMGMNTPLSLPSSIHALQAPDSGLHYSHFNPHFLHQAQPFADHFSHHQNMHHSQQSYAPPSHFLQHQDSGYAAMDDSPQKVTPTGNDVHSAQPNMASSMAQMDAMKGSLLSSSDKFRFHTTLNAPTAMVRNNDEIPITYLNKGQAYTMSIFDTVPPNQHPGVPLKYRTYVRISFEDGQQRAKPGSCWQLWKEGRGSNEAHQRGGKLLAVEYVDPNQGGDEELRKSQIELEKASFDGFAVTWYPNHRAPGAPDCSISVRFNFLSTDFSHSKGVKGIPVRLCAKTELLTPTIGQTANEPEVCFSKVKLFRDHGAERKLSNDVAHVRKSIDKLKQQITQAESGVTNTGKRKRSGSMAKGEAGKLSAEEDLHIKLMALQDMFSSTRPVSILFLKGESEDDPDLFPVKLPGGEEIKPLQRTATWESRHSGSESPGSNVSPTPTAGSLTPKRKFSEMQQSAITEEAEDEDRSDYRASPSPSVASRPIKILKTEHDASKVDILALDVDQSYQPPKVDKPIKPVACFYVKTSTSKSQYYRAVYLLQRTVTDLVNGIAEKFDMDPRRITQVFHLTKRGLKVVVDEDVVRELPEGQDMMVEFSPIQHSSSTDPSVASEHRPSYLAGSSRGSGRPPPQPPPTVTAGGSGASGSHEGSRTGEGTICADFGFLSEDQSNISAHDALEMWLNY